MLYFPSPGLGQEAGDMSSMMVHCLRCVIKILLSLFQYLCLDIKYVILNMHASVFASVHDKSKEREKFHGIKICTNTQAILRIAHYSLTHDALYSKLRRFASVFVRILKAWKFWHKRHAKGSSGSSA